MFMVHQVQMGSVSRIVEPEKEEPKVREDDTVEGPAKVFMIDQCSVESKWFV